MAATEVVRPQDLAQYKSDLVEAVINAYMRDLNLDVPGESGFHCTKGSCDDGRFTFWIEDGHEGAEYYCDYPSGQWHISNLLWDYDQDTGDNVYDNELFDAKALYADLEQWVDQWIDPWTSRCPSPNVFTNQINSLANIAKQLYVGDQIVFGGQGVDAVGTADSTSGTSAISDLRSALDEMDLNLDDLRGQAIDALQRSYTYDVERTIGGQRGMATAAGLALTAEAMAWNETYISLRDFMRKATHDFNSFAGVESASGENVVALLGAVSAISGLAGGTIGAAFPPFGIAMAAVSGATAIAGLVFPTREATRADPLVLSGGDFSEQWSSFTDGIKRINTDLRDAEVSIAEACNRMIEDYQAFPDNYSITATTAKGKQGPEDDLTAFLETTIDFNDKKMRNIAGAVESVGAHQRALAGVLGGVDGSGNPSALVIDEWDRGWLPEVGSMGSGYPGPYWALANLVDQLTDLLVTESRTAHRVAEKCIEVARDFTATDAEREAELKGLLRTWDTIAIPVANPPES